MALLHDMLGAAQDNARHVWRIAATRREYELRYFVRANC